VSRGVSNAISTTSYYVVLLGGVFLALGAAGVDFSRFSILVGALGVGIGFGLQNVVNNFVSGLILLFERPIEVGDTIEIGGSHGRLEATGRGVISCVIEALRHRGLDIAGGVTGNAVIRASVSGAQDSITRGSTIAAPLRQSGEFPSMVTHMISVGEASGELEGMLAKVADIYDDLVDNSLNRLTTFMGPVLLLIVAGLVVLIIVSTLLPLLSLTAAL